MSTSMTVLFYARKSMANNQGEYPIYMRTTIAGERFEIGTKRFILPDNRSTETGRMKGASSNARYKDMKWWLMYQARTHLVY